MERSGNHAARYGPDVPGERELRLLGDLKGKRVLELGCGTGQASIAFARQGATAIAVDTSATRLAEARRLAEQEEARVEWHHGDLADLAFLRADSIDVCFSAYALAEVEDVNRQFRQVHRVLRPHGIFAFSYQHPMALCVEREHAPDEGAALPLGDLVVRRSYFDDAPIADERGGETVVVHPRTVSDVFVALGRTGFRVDAILEPRPTGAETMPLVPSTIVWRARKEGM